MAQVVSDLRNLAFVGHPSGGKTTLVDALAHKTGVTDRRGTVADKTSICDTEPEEQEKAHTLQLSCVHAKYADRTWNFIDTPGYPDFISETIGGMFASNLVVGVVSCASGVTFNFRTKMALATSVKRGRAVVVTHIDGDNANFDETLENLRTALGDACVPITLPDQSGHDFSSVTSVLWDADSEWRSPILDAVMDACANEELLNQYLETMTLSDEQLAENLPKAIATGAIIPVFSVHPETGIGLDEFLSFMARFGTCPATRPTIEVDGEVVSPDPDGELLGVVFNVKSDAHVGKVCLARIVRGTLKSAQLLVGKRGDHPKGEKPGGLFHVVGGKTRENIEEAVAGEIVAFSKVEGLDVGEAFALHGHDVPETSFVMIPRPMVAWAIEPKSRADEQKIGTALHKLTAEDPTLVVDHDEKTHELILRGMSDLHLQISEMRLKRRYGVEIVSHVPRIAYQETITKPAEAHYRHKKQSGGRGQFGECYLRLRPGEKDSGIVFTDKVVGGSIPRNLIPAVEKGIREIAGSGVLTKSKVVDVEVELYDGKFHQVDSDEASFKMAGGRAFKEGVLAAGPVLLEPVMAVEIHVPSDDAGTIFSDITSHRRGHVIDQESEEGGHITVIKAHVPLATMQTYHRDLKSQTAGEGTYSMELDHYANVPASEQAKVIAECEKVAEEAAHH